MKLRYLRLGIAILISAAIVACVGAYLKYGLLKPYDLYQDKSIFELPFLMHSDEALKFMIEELLETPPTAEPDAPEPTVTEPATTDSLTQPTEPTEPTDSIDTTQPPVTVPPTEADPPSGYPDFDFPGGVNESWFDDVLFIGDSRTVGLKSYARSGNADYFCDVGASVFNIRTKELSDTTFAAQTLEKLLTSKTYGKIFINLGLNEIGYPAASVNSAYKKLIDLVREKQPDAIIILQGVMAVTEKKAAQADYFSPESIKQLKDKIKSHANGEDIFYIDCNVYFADSNGYLYAKLTNDGYHPTGSGYKHWRNWIHWAVAQIDN